MAFILLVALYTIAWDLITLIISRGSDYFWMWWIRVLQLHHHT